MNKTLVSRLVLFLLLFLLKPVSSMWSLKSWAKELYSNDKNTLSDNQISSNLKTQTILTSSTLIPLKATYEPSSKIPCY